MIVVDASVLAPALADDTSDGDAARDVLRGETLIAPELIDLEVASVWRRHVSTGQLDPRKADLALRDLDVLPLQRVSHRALLTRCWALRENLTLYGAAYVALAELLEVVLVTGDKKLAKAPGLRCRIRVIG
ncbi:type II toxin-antitoxin system VapC family toxin [Rathayibacter soli]|uniref:type II toxin-antitoxin system VapC family toxin n=1 Tax=Rathayibacter soli TaxID=3144168 RepID=UPI0027E4B9A7|nr:type II toxin-antitoxin system VapC family toxin [Glaciibacter superstes]